MQHKISIGVDIGGTHITSALVNLSEKSLIADSILRFHIDAHADEQHIYQQWAQAITPHLAHCQHIGIAMPGPFDYAQGIALMTGQDKYDALYKINVKEGLAKVLQLEAGQIKFLNDAACFLQGEVVGGAAKGHTSALGFTLGTGLGSTYYQEQQAVDADMWNIPFLESMAEDYISSRWFTKKYQQLTNQSIANVKTITELGDTHPLVVQLFDEFSKNLAHFMAQVHQRHGGDIIVAGGSISKAWRLFGEKTIIALRKYHLHIPVVPAVLGENAALIGAGSLWLD